MPSTDEKNIAISKIKFQVACGITGVILIALLFWVYQLSKKTTGFPSELADALATQPVAAVVLLNGEGESSLFNRKGKPLTACARIDGTKVVPIGEGCGAAGEITNITAIQVLVSRESPGCEWIKDDGKKLYKIHADGPDEGEDPCHTPH